MILRPALVLRCALLAAAAVLLLPETALAFDPQPDPPVIPGWWWRWIFVWGP